MVLLSAISVLRRRESPEVRQPLWGLEDGSGVLMQEAAHVAVLPWEQPFQEADVATPVCDEQRNVGGVLGGLYGKGTDGGEGVICCIETEHRDPDGIYLGSRACCFVVGNTVLISKGHRCVALIKLADCAGLQVLP